MANDVTFDIIARDRASAQFSRVGRAAKESSGSLASFAGLAKKVFAAALIYEGAKKATEGLKSLAEAAAEDQTSAALMAKQFRNSAHATREQVKATEDWITKVGRAKGVADDELRPALGNLVTATHNVRKAQELTSLAMDVATAKHKPLAAVSLALAKAYNGNLGGLGRYGIKTKDAAGKTLTFAAAQKELQKQFGGAAAAKAKTFTGVMDRFHVVVQETKESLGAKLLPVLTRFGNWFLSIGAPAVAKYAGIIKTALTPAFKAIGDFLGTKLIPWFKQFGDSSTQQGRLLQQFGAAAKSVFANVASIFQSTKSIVQSFWGKYGDLITKYGIGTLRNLLTVTKGAFNVIAGLFKVIASVMKGDWSGAWAGVKQITRGAVGIVTGLIGQMWNQVRTVFAAGIRTIGTVMKNLPGAILKGLGNLGTLLYNAGRSVISGLINGIESKFGDVKNKLGDLTNKLTSWKGPPAKDRTLLTPAGQMIIDGLIRGIESRRGALKTVLGRLTAMISDAGSRLASLKDVRSGFASTFSSDSIFGADLSGGGGLSGLLQFQQQQATNASQLLADIRAVTSNGLSKSLVAQLQSAGSSGAAQLHLLAGASAGQIAQFNAANAVAGSANAQAGLVAGNYVRGGNIDKQITAEQIRLATRQGMLEALQHAHLSTKVSGRDLIVVLRAEAKSSGKSTVQALA